MFSQQISVETIFSDKISIRAIEIYDNKIWYSGTDSKFGFVDLENPKKRKQIKLSEKKMQFRTLGQDRNSFYTINIESPAYFFKIDKKDFTFQNIYTDTVKTAFYDALHFVDNHSVYAFSDPDKNSNLRLAVYTKDSWSLLYHNLKLNEGETAFAASNTNIVSKQNYLWIATGGKTSRILRLNVGNGNFEIFETPFIQGESSQGIYSIDFYDEVGIAVGGNYTKQEANINNIATTNDGGKTWQVQASGLNFRLWENLEKNFR